MTELLYQKDSYQKEFDAVVTKVTEMDGKTFVVLDKTCFHPHGGGQATDTGKLVCNVDGNGVEYNVVFAKKFGDDVSHEVDKPGLKQGYSIYGIIDWDRRYKLMRMHTAAHILSGVVHKETNALITGNQLNLDISRVDFSLENFDREKIDEYVNIANGIVEKDLPVEISFMKRAEAEQLPAISKLAAGLPPSVEILRIVSIKDFDTQADGGTHVNSTKEVGKLKVLKCENKGAKNRRIYFELE